MILNVIKKVLFIILIVINYSLYGQGLSNLRSGFVHYKGDTIKIDSLSIIPGSVEIRDSTGSKLDSINYTFDYAKSLLVIKDRTFLKQRLSVSYRVFPYNFAKEYFHKDSRIPQNVIGTPLEEPYVYTYNKGQNDVLSLGSLNKSGSIMRGISFGNNQDAVLNSSLNLQMTGTLSDDVEIAAAITDNNIPIQPEGNTQQIQEFDKVFIQLTMKKKFKLIAGDFELHRPESYFMNFYKKSQGGYFTSDISFTTKDKKKGHWGTSLAGALSKGMYAKNTITPIDGNQGPYKLTGANNERYIIVLAGSEKIYIDGRLLTRGQENDYVIDYNTAEVTFTPRNMITKDKRLTAEFEYSNLNYQRSLFFAGTDYENDKLKVRFNIYSEQDIKTQPLQQTLTDQQKNILSSVGDSIQNAISSTIQKVSFNSDQIFYKMIDTLGYDSVLVYSTDPKVALYTAGFSYVGTGKGRYVLMNSLANGKVYQFAGPHLGDYEPVTLLIAPKKKQMYTLGADYAFSKNTSLSAEVALSNNDLNTFSSINDGDNIGYAFKVNLKDTRQLEKNNPNSWTLTTQAGTEFTQKHFSAIERYKTVEFERDWNIGTNILNDIDNENISSFGLALNKIKKGALTYQLNSYVKGNIYNGFQNIMNGEYFIHNLRTFYSGSYLKSNQSLTNTDFYRHSTGIEENLKVFKLGLKSDMERNTFKEVKNDTLQTTSFYFYSWEAFITNPDSLRNKYLLKYNRRYDYAPENNDFRKASYSDNATLSLDLLKNPSRTLKFSTTYRKLTVLDTTITKARSDNSLVSRLEYFIKALKGTVNSTTFYEFGSGMEYKKSYQFIEVPAGKGVYQWTDYNGDGIKQLNEYEIATYSDQAKYIKVYTLTNESVHAYYNQFNEVLLVNPAALWSGKKGIKGWLSKFSNQTSYKLDGKTSDQNILKAIDPSLSGISIDNIISLNSYFRDALLFNQSNSKFGMTMTYQENSNKNLLVNGFESRHTITRSILTRLNIIRNYDFKMTLSSGSITSGSDFYTDKNFLINNLSAEPVLTYQPSLNFNIAMTYKYSTKKNAKLSGEEALVNRFVLESKYNTSQKGRLNAKMGYVLISYDFPVNTSIAYEMLEGLQPGKNYTWGLSYERTILSNMQMSINYDGRKSQSNKAINTATVQVRAFF
ncbi:MAG: hypothetical protein Q8880_06965 [Bacteroidota bacterium]|nr:hypothetical protein [Bacteroidota bacterium]